MKLADVVQQIRADHVGRLDAWRAERARLEQAIVDHPTWAAAARRKIAALDVRIRDAERALHLADDVLAPTPGHAERSTTT